MVRNVLALVLGLILGGIANMALVTVSTVMNPLPEGVVPNDLEAVREHMLEHPMPTGALLMVLAAHSGGSFVSGLVCGLVARRRWYRAAFGMGVLWMCGGIYMLTVLPSPPWFAVADVLLYVPAALAGVQLGGSRADGLSDNIA